MEIALIIIFVLGYLGITLEHTLKMDKLIPALAMMSLLWALVALFHIPVFEIIDGLVPVEHMDEVLLHHLGKTAEILVFLMGAMTIVEITDHFNGFGAIKQFVKTKEKKVLLWIMGILAFILSAIIDNLTATIVLITILKKLVDSQEDRMWFAGLIIICANAGGAWSPIGDVTTTMLWIGDKVSTLNLLKYLFIPSMVCMAIPTLIASFLPAFQGQLTTPKSGADDKPASLGMLILGLGSIVFVPVFKTVTHLPPYVGMMLSLAVVATVAEIKSARSFTMSEAAHHHSPVHTSLARIEMPSILFFLGILMAVAALESVGMIFQLGESVRSAIPDDVFVVLLGIGSAIIGTGGSMLIIGSAAGVVAMGMERIDFIWYFKKIAWLAFIGFIAGCGVFYAMVNYVL